MADQVLSVSSSTLVVGAIGPLNSFKEAAFHTQHWTKTKDPPIFIQFGRTSPKSNCKVYNDLLQSPSQEPHQHGWKPAIIKDTNIFKVQVGPAGDKNGYTAITGIQSWGIAYWVNNKLIPKIYVKRGTNYTFIVEGGKNPSTQAKYHPLYITNNNEGGGGQDPSLLRTKAHEVYAGVRFTPNGADPSIGAGRYCELKAKTIDKAKEVNSIDEYFGTLRRDCEPGEPAVFTWTPDENTPSVVYYQVQCFDLVCLIKTN